MEYKQYGKEAYNIIISSISGISTDNSKLLDTWKQRRKQRKESR